MGIVVFILWLVLAFNGAANRGRSFGGFLALSILFSPLIGAFILFVLGEKK
ncbi:MAG: hypothetical protein IJP61_01145 [Treponema sp.]|nr:hypothetical protein [Treponema sp.]